MIITVVLLDFILAVGGAFSGFPTCIRWSRARCFVGTERELFSVFFLERYGEGETTTSVRKKAKTQTRKRRAEAEVVSTKGAKVRSAKAFKIPMKEQAGDSALAFENFRKGARERKGKEHGDDKAYSSDCNGNLIDRSRAEKGKEREGVVLVADIASDGHIQRASGETAAAGDRDGDDSVVIVESDDNRGGEYTSSDDTVEILSSSSDEQKEDHYTKRTVLPADDDDLTLRDVVSDNEQILENLGKRMLWVAFGPVNLR